MTVVVPSWTAEPFVSRIESECSDVSNHILGVPTIEFVAPIFIGMVVVAFRILLTSTMVRSPVDESIAE